MDESFEDRLKRLLSEAEVRLAEEKANLGNADLAEIPTRLSKIANNETEVLMFLAGVRDQFGTFWAEDAYQAWATLRGEEPPQSLPYRQARHALEQYTGAVGYFRIAPVPTKTGTCQLQGCLMPASFEVVVGTRVKLCDAHTSAVT